MPSRSLFAYAHTACVSGYRATGAIRPSHPANTRWKRVLRRMLFVLTTTSSVIEPALAERTKKTGINAGFKIVVMEIR